MENIVKTELENLQLQFGDKTMLTLDDYAKLYNLNRRNVSQHVRRRGIPYTKEGKEIYISLMDLAEYKAKHKNGITQQPPAPFSNQGAEMKRRRGFNSQSKG